MHIVVRAESPFLEYFDMLEYVYFSNKTNAQSHKSARETFILRSLTANFVFSSIISKYF